MASKTKPGLGGWVSTHPGFLTFPERVTVKREQGLSTDISGAAVQLGRSCCQTGTAQRSESLPATRGWMLLTMV